MALNIEPIDRNQTTAFREREILRQKVNEIIETVTPMEFQWDAVPTAGHGVGYVVTSEGVKTAIDSEATIRRAEDIGLSDAITAEETARDEADDALGLLIRTEENTRAEADTALGNRITAEETARANADATLGIRIDGKQNTLTQGTGITIENDVISATGISVTAGTGIRIADGVISQTNIRFQEGRRIASDFFTHLRTNLTNITPFTLVMWSEGTPVSLAYFSFTGSRLQQGKCFGSGMLLFDGAMHLVYEVDGLDTSDDSITVYYYNIQTGTRSQEAFSKMTLESENLMGYFNVGTV